MATTSWSETKTFACGDRQPDTAPTFSFVNVTHFTKEEQNISFQLDFFRKINFTVEQKVSSKESNS